MDQPPSYQPEFVPMNGNKYTSLEDPRGAPKFQHTVVLGLPQPVVPQPRDHIIWSLCSLVYGNPLCLGMLAVYFSIKSRDRKMVGDLEGARKHGKTARCFNVVTLTLVILGLLFLFIIYGFFIYNISHL
ncbi:dispanin subfamily A member 2b-like [Oncorhynchus clarkii lewisi]|uniref:dispanin subfamily A member 2b-like n=1 Tax=Oncorhynchus clarkii lewisi TaxID=490388 RepID=UPI0039B99281